MPKTLLIITGLYVALFCGSISSLQAAPDTHFGHVRSTCEMPEGKNSITVPFRTYNNLVVIDLVSATGTIIPVCLDTGCPLDGLLLFEGDYIDDLDWPWEGKAVLPGASEMPDEPNVAFSRALTLGELRLTQHMVMRTPRLFKDATIEGVIGLSLLGALVVEINYDTSEMRLTRPQTFEWSGPETPLTIVPPFHGIPTITCTVEAGDGTLVPLRCALDLGAHFTLRINYASRDQIRPKADSLHCLLGKSLYGRAWGELGRYTLSLGGHVFEEAFVSFTEADDPVPLDLPILGSRLLKRFNLTIDYTQGHIYLQPNSTYSLPFVFDMSGLELEPDADGTYLVIGVLDESPAKEQGVQIDDRIVSLDTKPSQQINFDELKALLRQEGHILQVGLERDGRLLEVQLKLRPLL